MYLEKNDLALKRMYNQFLPHTTSGFIPLKDTDITGRLINKIISSLTLDWRIKFRDDDPDLSMQFEDLWFVVLRDSFFYFLKKHYGIITDLTDNLIKSYLYDLYFGKFTDRVIGVYTHQDAFIKYLTKDFPNIPAAFVDFDSLLDEYEYISVAQKCIVVIKK